VGNGPERLKDAQKTERGGSVRSLFIHEASHPEDGGPRKGGQAITRSPGDLAGARWLQPKEEESSPGRALEPLATFCYVQRGPTIARASGESCASRAVCSKREVEYREKKSYRKEKNKQQREENREI